VISNRREAAVSRATMLGRGRREVRNHATSDAVFEADEMEFLRAIEDFKFRTGKKFPTWTEVLNVVKSLGYIKPY
jgi:hypothetical protein